MKKFWITNSNQGNFHSLSIKWAETRESNCEEGIYSDDLDFIISVYKKIKTSIFSSYINKVDKPYWLTENWVNEIVIKDSSGKIMKLNEIKIP